MNGYGTTGMVQIPKCMPENLICLLGRWEEGNLRFDSDLHRVTPENHRGQKVKQSTCLGDM